MQTADQLLLERWRAEGDAAAFREITARYAGLVYVAAKRVLKDASDAEDVAQECFEALALRRDTAPTYLGAWLHAVATNRALNFLESAQRRRAREERAAAATPEYSRTEWDDLYEHVDAVIAELPEEFRVAIVGHFLEGQSKTDLARTLGVSRPAIHYRIDKGLDQVRHALRQRGVTASAGAFVAAMAAQASEAVPGSLVAGLGKIAMTGVSAMGQSASPIVVTTMAGSIVMKKAILVVVAIAMVGAAGFVLREQTPVSPEPPTSLQVAASTALSVADEVVETAGEVVKQPAGDANPVTSELHPPAGYAAEDQARGENPYHGDLAISGRVVDSRGNPIPGAYVTVFFADRSAVGKSDGRFRLEGLAASRFSGFARHDDYSDQDFSADAGDENVLIVLQDRATVSGRVVDAKTGVAVPQFTISSQDGIQSILEPTLIQESSSVDDSLGQFRLSAVKTGESTLIVEADGYATAYKAIRLDSSNPLEDVVIEIRPGSTAEGVVTDVVGRPIGGAWLFSESPPPISALKQVAAGKRQHLAEHIVATSGESGGFSIQNLRGDETTLYAFHPEYGFGTTLLEWEDVAMLHDLHLVLENDTTGSADVQVLIAGKPVAGATVYVSDLGGRGTPLQEAVTGPDGRATLTDLPQGPAGVWAPYPDQRYLARRRNVNTRIERGETTSVEIDFAPLSATLEGQVRLGNQPASGGFIELRLLDEDQTESYFHLGPLPGGTFRFDAIATGEGMLKISAGFQDGPRVKSMSVQIVEGDKQKLDINLAGDGSLEGIIANMPEATHGIIKVLSGKQTIENVAEARSPALDSILEGEVLVNPDGTYEVKDIAAGRYTVLLTIVSTLGPESDTDARFATAMVEIVDGETATTDFDMSE